MSKFDDLAMLALAARAATTIGSIPIVETDSGLQILESGPDLDGVETYKPWIPHKDKAQAFELVLELGIGLCVDLRGAYSSAWTFDDPDEVIEVCHSTYIPEEATCRAIVMAAATWGRDMLFRND